jgi:hypothetical protein
MKTEKCLWFISSFINVLLGGQWPETLCSRCFRLQSHWWFSIWFNFWNYVSLNEEHCLESYLYYERRTRLKREQTRRRREERRRKEKAKRTRTIPH